MRKPGVSEARALLAAVSLLVLGAVLGIAVDRHVIRTPILTSPARFHHDALASLQDHLDLDSTQRNKVDSIMRAHRAALHRTWATLHTQLGATVDTVHRDIEAVLTREQQTQFREWLGEMLRPDH